MARTPSARIATVGRLRILCIDVGGTGLKAAIVNDAGKLLTKPARVATPVGGTPNEIVETLARLAAPLGKYDCVSVGFPGVVRKGKVLTAPNLHNAGWKGFDLRAALRKTLGRPVRVGNDADVAGLAVISRRGVEMIITLGTGFGTGLYVDGRLAPHLELSHHEFRKGETYDEQLGDATRKAIGKKKWNKRVKLAIKNVRALTNFDHLYIGGGDASRINFELDPDVTIVPNLAGIAGGVALWRRRFRMKEAQ
jgi:polyphosphate glucokinase